MIDFVSTQTADLQTRNCAKLLAAVIESAIRDASTIPTKNELKNKKNMEVDASMAIDFLFNSTSVCSLYCSLIGIDYSNLRRALLQGTWQQKKPRGIAMPSQKALVWRFGHEIDWEKVQSGLDLIKRADEKEARRNSKRKVFFTQEQWALKKT